MHVFDLDTHFFQVIGQILRHLLGQGGDKDPLALVCPSIDFAQKVIHLAHGWPHFYFWVEEACRPDDLLNNGIGLFPLIIARGSRNIDNLVDMAFKFFPAQGTIVQS